MEIKKGVTSDFCESSVTGDVFDVVFHCGATQETEQKEAGRPSEENQVVLSCTCRNVV